jgi:hypothetical protein
MIVSKMKLCVTTHSKMTVSRMPLRRMSGMRRIKPKKMTGSRLKLKMQMLSLMPVIKMTFYRITANDKV